MNDPKAFDAAVQRSLDALNTKPIGGLKRSRAITDKRAQNRIANRIAHALPQDVKRYYIKKYNADFEDAFLRLLRGSDHVCDECHCERPNHQTVRMFAEMTGAVGAPTQFLVGLLAKVGAKDETELATLVDSGRRLEQLTQEAGGNLETMRDDALSVLAHCLREHPEWRQGIIGGLLPDASEGTNGPGLDPEHKNGGTNG